MMTRQKETGTTEEAWAFHSPRRKNVDWSKGSDLEQQNGFAFSKLAVLTWGFALQFGNFPGSGVGLMPGNERSHDCMDII